MGAAVAPTPDVKPRRAPERRRRPTTKAEVDGRRPLTVAPRPRRVSGPAPRSRPARRRSAAQSGIAFGLLAVLERLPRLRPGSLRSARPRPVDGLTDRRSAGGRIWIALVAFALIGIVTLQLVLLKLNASIGHGLEREALLQRENAALSIENSEMAASHGIESRAERIGMELVPPGALRFLGAPRGSDVNRAAAVLSTSVRGSTAGFPEAPLGGSGTPGQSSASSSTAEPARTESVTSPSSAGALGTASAESRTASVEPTSGRAAQEPRRTPAESTATPEPPRSSASAPSSVTVPGGSSSAEAAPAGGTQAGPQG